MILLTHFISFSVLSVQPQAELKAEESKPSGVLLRFAAYVSRLQVFPTNPQVISARDREYFSDAIIVSMFFCACQYIYSSV